MEKITKSGLSKYLSVCGIASRRKSCEMIRNGMVAVNGEIIREPGFKISSADEVSCNGQVLQIPGKLYIMLNKPVGYLCTSDDPHASRKAIDLIKLPPGTAAVRLFSAGRLDKDSEGLLIFTNDGEYAERIMHPRYGVLKRYRVITDAGIPEPELERLRHGISDGNEVLRPEKIIRTGRCRYLFILNEGRKREIRRLVKSAGTAVKTLKRIMLGSLKLGNLPSGKWRCLSPDDIKASLTNPPGAQ
ncbi:MAG: pseudouridine synthase [Victivallales bacterium]|nr:pseudouridine synthase [Victivallales bacterium]